MKTRYILPALLALSAVATSSQVIAEGLTYDPTANYYSEYYGIGVESAVENSAAETTKVADTAFYDPYEDYYNTYYDMDGLKDTPSSVKSQKTGLEDYPDMADPTNYFKW